MSTSINFTTNQEVKEYCKLMLEQTDYTQLPDVYISNKEEFAIYRESIRFIFLNPTMGVFFPQQPQPIWTSESI